MKHKDRPVAKAERRAPGPFRRFFRDRKGSTAIEFAALALPFSMLLFAIFETCISIAGQQILANATDDVARQLRTGQIKAADVNETKLKKLICDHLDVIVASGCPGLIVDLRKFDTFALAAQVKFKIVGKKLDKTGIAVAPGGSLSKNMLRVFYEWPVMTDLLRLAMSNIDDDKTLLFASATWQNEPFDD